MRTVQDAEETLIRRSICVKNVCMTQPPLRLAQPLGKIVTRRWVTRGLVAPTHDGLQFSLAIHPDALPELHFDNMPRFQRWHAIKAALEKDQVLNRAQLELYFHCDPDDLSALWHRELEFSPVHGRDQRFQTTAYAATPQALDCLPGHLAKRMALAELRLINPPPGDYTWTLGGTEKYGGYCVDAICRLGDRQWAIIYDNSTYPLSKVPGRIEGLLQEFGRVRWIIPFSTPTSSGEERQRNRLQTVRQLLNEQLPQQMAAQVIAVEPSYVWCRHLYPESKARGRSR